MFEILFPSIYVASLSGLLAVSRFENQRWVRAQARGLSGNIWVDLVVTSTGFLSLLFGLAFLVSWGLQFGWAAAGGLVLISFIVPMLWTILFRATDNWLIWLIGSIAVWPLMILLASQTNWFGLFQ